MRDFSEVTVSVNSTQYVGVFYSPDYHLVSVMLVTTDHDHDPTVEQAHTLLILIHYFTIVMDCTLFSIFSHTETNLIWD